MSDLYYTCKSMWVMNIYYRYLIISSCNIKYKMAFSSVACVEQTAPSTEKYVLVKLYKILYKNGCIKRNILIIFNICSSKNLHLWFCVYFCVFWKIAHDSVYVCIYEKEYVCICLRL